MNFMLKILSILILYSNGILAQQDLEFCDINNLPADPLQLKIPTLNDTDQYQAVLERNDFGVTEEIIEFFDGKANLGIAITTLAGKITRSYANFLRNELLLVEGKKCSYRKLNESYQLTPFFLIIDDQGKEHIVSPLNLALKNLKFVYTGSSSFIRGIPVNEWQTCTFNTIKKETVKITLSYSNDKKWSPAQIIQDFPSIPVEVLIETKNQNGDYNSENFSIFKYKHGIDLEIEDYFLPPGVFCPGLPNSSPLPPIPKSFSFANQLVETFEDVLDKAGRVDRIREEYDFEAKIFRYDYDIKNTPTTEIHDFNTGLNYIKNRLTGGCKIEKLKGGSPDSQKNGTLIEIRDPVSFFDFDNAEIHFVGLKRTDGILANIWIGKKKINGQDAIIEWHFLAQTWNKTEWTQQYETTPLKIIIFTPAVIPGTNITGTAKFTNNIFYFREHELNIYDFNIRPCLEDRPRQTLSISISSKYTNVIESNLLSFSRGFVMAIKDAARITILRITPPRLAFSKDIIIASFNIFERSEYGDVIIPKDDVILEDAVENLKKYFAQNQLEIKFLDDFKNNVSVYGLSKSLNDHFESDGIETIRIGNIDNGFSGISIAIIVIVVLIMGSLIGLLLTILHKYEKIKLPLVN